MPLTPGSRLGPYEIVSAIGAGGMGEVYRARDTRLGRDVAIKVLPASFSTDADRLRRFEQEARAAGVLNHPNITAVYDIGQQDGAPYVVQELLEGETLRSVLAGSKLSTRKAIDYSLQIVHGLAAAHEKGIVHRDLKPENIFVTNDGRVKILDFGLAKLTLVEGKDQGTSLPTATQGTEPGVVMGTLGYMSPEQVRGRPADARSDIFSFGAILYEMLSGRRAFHGDSAADTMSSILKEDPPDLSVTNQNVPPGLERIVRHCLEKNPEQRFHSAHDLAFDIEALSGISQPRAATSATPRTRLRLPAWLAAAAALAAGLLAGRTLWKQPPISPPSFHRTTFQRGFVISSRFAPDGQTIAYSARWDGAIMPDIYSKRLDSVAPQRLGMQGLVESLSRSGEMLILHHPRFNSGFTRVATLARAPLTGGAARDLLEDVQDADWLPNGESIAAIRAPDWRYQLEFPAGKVLYKTNGWITEVRVSPRGDLAAFLDHPQFGDDRGDVAVIDLAGRKRVLSTGWASEQGLAWSPSGDEVWFTATETGSGRQLWAVTLSGRRRGIAAAPGDLTIQDISRDGRVLVDHSKNTVGVLGLSAGETRERELSALDWSRAPILSEDGKTVVFTEEGEGSAPGYSVFLRIMDGSPSLRLGEGGGLALSPDGKWVLAARMRTSPVELVLLPTGAGEPRPVKNLPIGVETGNGRFFPDGRRILFVGSAAGKPRRTYALDLDGGTPRAVTPENVWGTVLSPDSRLLVGTGPDEKLGLYPVDGGASRPLPGQQPGDRPLQWSSDGRSLFVSQRRAPDVTNVQGYAARVARIDVETGRREPWSEFRPSDSSGMTGLGVSDMTRDGKTFVFTYFRSLSDLYVAEGWK